MTHRPEHTNWRRLDDGGVQVMIRSRIAPPARTAAFGALYEYRVHADGRILLSVSVEPEGDLYEPLPRIGLRARAPLALERVRWYGRGPGESYADSCSAARLGVWEAAVAELHTDYVRPQENGNRSGVRWVLFSDLRGMGFLAAATPGAAAEMLNFSARTYTEESLERARHPVDLQPSDRLVINLDHAQCGLGSASCGPGPLPQYLLSASAVKFRVWLRPFSLDTGSPMRAWRSLTRCAE